MIKGIEYFRECCEKMQISFEEVFCYGRGKKYYIKNKKKRYVFEPSSKQLRPYHKYVIKYFSEKDIFLCWDMKYNKKPKREDFSLDGDDVAFALENNQRIVYKNIEHPSWKQEPVYVLKTCDVLDFLGKIDK